MHSFMIGNEAFPSEQHAQPPIAEAWPLFGKLYQSALYNRLLVHQLCFSLRTISGCGSVYADYSARPALRYLIRGCEVDYRLTLNAGRYHFLLERQSWLE